MSAISVMLPRLEYAIREVSRALEQTSILSPCWHAMSEEDLWRELVACILGSRVRYDIAHAATVLMASANLFSMPLQSSGREKYGHNVLRALSSTDNSQTGSSLPCRYPFPRLRAKQISLAAETLYANGGTISSLLHKAEDLHTVRRRLSEEVAGLGPKQASLFLRNVGYARHVAVLDVHVLTYMNWIGLTRSPQKAVRTVRQYELLEEAFIEHSYSAGFRPDLFDIAVWVVVRVAKKEYTLCL